MLHRDTPLAGCHGPSAALSRREWLTRSGYGLGGAALAWLLAREAVAEGGGENLPYPPRARRIIFLHQSGAPSQIDLFDPKPELTRRHGEELPESIRQGQRLTTMTADQAEKPLTASPFRFRPHGAAGLEISELLPYTARIADELCLVRSLHTEAINHDPGVTLLQTGSQTPGRPSFGSWVSYGLGSLNDNLPTFTVLISGGEPGDQPLYQRLWGHSFLPAAHQGVRLRSQQGLLLYAADPPGVDRDARRRMLDRAAAMNRRFAAATGDSTVDDRIAQFELAYRMQTAVPALADVSNEPEETFTLYGDDARRPGTYAHHCLLARRMVERDVRFVQLYHRDWDHHSRLPPRLRQKCQETDQASAALVIDLRRRGLLDDTLVVWAGEFGRTAYCQGELTGETYGRDHHPRCFSIWLAGGGVRRGFAYGRTDEFSYNVVEGGVHIHDLQATLLRLLGLDHERLTFRSQGRDFRLTDVAGRVVNEMLA